MRKTDLTALQASFASNTLRQIWIYAAVSADLAVAAEWGQLTYLLRATLRRSRISIRKIFQEVTRGALELVTVDQSTVPAGFTVIVPTRDGGQMLERCIASLLTCYGDQIQLIVVDNGSRDRWTLNYLSKLEHSGVEIIRADIEFNFSRLNNLAVHSAKHEVLCFLNDDIEVTDKDFLIRLGSIAQLPDVGAVGPILRYPNGLVQHAGVYLWREGSAFHMGRGRNDQKLNALGIPSDPHYLMSVTGACLVVQKTRFLEVGGFDEELAVGLNDVDLCLRLRTRGFKSVLATQTSLVHFESASRGKSFTRNSLKVAIWESLIFENRWSSTFPQDPYCKWRFKRPVKLASKSSNKNQCEQNQKP